MLRKMKKLETIETTCNQNQPMTKKTKQPKPPEQFEFEIFDQFDNGELEELKKDAQAFYLCNTAPCSGFDEASDEYFAAAANSIKELSRWWPHLRRVARIQKCTDS